MRGERVEDLLFALLPTFDEALRRKTPQIDPFGVGDVAREGGKDRITKLPVIVRERAWSLARTAASRRRARQREAKTPRGMVGGVCEASGLRSRSSTA